jgi:hypothetical protein
MTSKSLIHKGSCHCKKVMFEAEGEFDSVLECNCSHCQRKGYLLWFIPKDKFHLRTKESDLSTYTFNKHVIKHHFCKVCGCAPFGFGTDPKTNTPTAAINVRCLEGIELSTLKRIPYDGRSV